MLKIIPILCRAGKMDNYAYLLIDKATKISAIIDPSEVAPIVEECEKQGIKPNYIFNTHHHYDHIDGNLPLKELYGAKIVACEADKHRIDGVDITVNDGDVFMLGESKAEIIRVDGHTIGHILWYFKQDKVLFTGDTLFNLCIGGLFEGSAEQMWASLSKIKKLPDDVMFYPGHEYSVYGMSNLEGPAGVQYAKKAQERLAKGLPVSPVSLGEEKKVNPYLGATDLEDFYNLMS